ncbi:MAG: hypothetical protein ACT4OS_06355 [Acidimicrobiales bacterium]
MASTGAASTGAASTGARRRLTTWLAAAALAGLAMACSDSEEPATDSEAAAFTQDQADTVAAYTLVEYAFEGPTTVKGPNVFFTAENTGEEDHELEVLDASGEALGEVAAFAPGAKAAPFAAVMEPGTYTLQCILESADGQQHKDKGMVATLTVE